MSCTASLSSMFSGLRLGSDLLSNVRYLSGAHLLSQRNFHQVLLDLRRDAGLLRADRRRAAQLQIACRAQTPIETAFVTPGTIPTWSAASQTRVPTNTMNLALKYVRDLSRYWLQRSCMYHSRSTGSFRQGSQHGTGEQHATSLQPDVYEHTRPVKMTSSPNSNKVCHSWQTHLRSRGRSIPKYRRGLRGTPR